MSQFSAGTAVVDFKAGGQSAFARAAQNLAGVMNRFKVRATAALNAVKRGAFILGAAMAAAFAFSINEASKAAVVQAKLAQVIKSTGAAAGKSVDQLNEMSAKLRELTGIDDDLIGKNQALLLTFTNIKGDVFDDALKAALDMSAGMDQQLKPSIIQIGKALNDPVLGVTALRKVGVKFTESQRALIKSLVDTGRMMEAQRIILKELGVEFGGQAEAIGRGFGGRLAVLRLQIGDVADAFGTGLLPALTEITKEISLSAGKLKEWGETVGESVGNAISWVTKFREVFLLEMKATTVAGALFISEWVDVIVNGFKFVGAFIGTWAVNIMSIYGNLTQNIAEVSKNIFGTFLPQLMKGLLNFWTVMFLNMFEIAKGAFANIGQIAAGLFLSIEAGSLAPLQTALKVAAEDIKKTIQVLPDTFQDVDLDVLKNTVDILRDIQKVDSENKPSFITDVLKNTLADINNQIDALINKGGKSTAGKRDSILDTLTSEGDDDGGAADRKIGTGKFGAIEQNFRRIQEQIGKGDEAKKQRERIAANTKKTADAAGKFAKDVGSAVADAVKGISFGGAFAAGT